MIGPGDFIPKHPKGYTPGKGFTDQPEGLRVGIIERVDEINMKADVKILTGGGRRSELDLTQALSGPRSFWGGVPEVGAVVVIGYRMKQKQIAEAVILGYMNVGNRSGLRFDPFAPSDPNAIDPADADEYEAQFGKPYRTKRLKLRPGDVGGMSSSGSELVLSKSLRMCNRAGDLFELRDDERTVVSQSIHRIESDSGVKRISGPVRRQVFYIPPDVLSGPHQLKDQPDYYGRDELQAAGPGIPGSNTKWASSSGKLLDIFNNGTVYPPVTYASGKQVFYPSTIVGSTLEPENPDDGVGGAFTEDRLELSHDTDLTQEVCVEIDGFQVDRRKAFIERVLGTVVGNDPNSTQGIRQYGKVLRPQLWTSALSDTQGKFTLEECERKPGEDDKESRTSAGAVLLRVYNPDGPDEDNPFAFAVQKQGKVLLNVPKPSVERYPDAKGISVEANLLGALKMFVGAMQPSNTSIHATLAGGIKARVGHNTDTGNAVDVSFGSPVFASYDGAGNADGVGKSDSISGHYQLATSGDIQETVQGAMNTTVNGGYFMQADRAVVNAHSGYSLNAGELNMLISGKSQRNYAQAVIETIVSGGLQRTILAGGAVETILAGGKTVSVAAGATAFSNPAGAFSVTVGAGALSLTTASGALTLAASAGAVSMTSGTAMTLTAGGLLSITAPSTVISSANLQLGDATGNLGVVRGTPALPPGAPSLDYLTGLPLLGSALVRSV